MMRFNNTANSPPDFWRFTDPETGFVSKAVDHYNWMLQINAHRKGNGLPLISEAVAENQLCQQMPPGWCHHDDDEQHSRSWVNTRLRWSDIVEGTKAYVALIASGFKTVEQEEANRRAKICSSCYLRVQPQGCGSCVKLGQIVTGDLAQKKTPYDDHLVNMACAICSCPVKSLVHFEMPALDSTDSPEKQAAYPNFCWRKQGGENRIE